ncbi:hypothetical protein BGZ72_002970, partial [Mortierella alpina]
IIHAVGPTDSDKDVLRECYYSTLTLASQSGLRSLALPCISTGIYGFNAKDAAEVAVDAVRRWIKAHPDQADRMSIVFCTFLDKDRDRYTSVLNIAFKSGTIYMLPAVYVTNE